MANEQANTNIAVPKFFKDYNGGLETFEKNLKNLEDIADDSENPQQAAAKERLADIKKSIIFINKPNAEGVVEGEAIYARGVYYGAGSKINIDSDGTINVQTTDDQTTLSTDSSLIKVGQGKEGALEGEPAFKVTNPIGNYETGEKIILEQDTIYRVLYNMLNKTELPTAVKPYATLSGVAPGPYEVGSTITGELTGKFVDGYFKGAMEGDTWNKDKEQCKAGCKVTSISYSDSNGPLESNKFSHTFKRAETIIYSVNMSYNKSTNIAKDSVGNDMKDLVIPAGNAPASLSVRSDYKYFYGVGPYSGSGKIVINNQSEIISLPENSTAMGSSGWCGNGFTISKIQSQQTPNNLPNMIIVIPEGYQIIELTDSMGNPHSDRPTIDGLFKPQKEKIDGQYVEKRIDYTIGNTTTKYRVLSSYSTSGNTYYTNVKIKKS